MNCMSLPLCTIPGGVYRRGMGQEPVILSGGDPDAGMPYPQPQTHHHHQSQSLSLLLRVVSKNGSSLIKQSGQYQGSSSCSPNLWYSSTAFGMRPFFAPRTENPTLVSHNWLATHRTGELHGARIRFNITS